MKMIKVNQVNRREISKDWVSRECEAVWNNFESSWEVKRTSESQLNDFSNVLAEQMLWVEGLKVEI